MKPKYCSGESREQYQAMIANGLSGWGRRSDGSLGEDLVHPIRHLGALRYPVLDAIALQFDAGGVGARVVSPDHSHRTAVAGALLFNDHDAIVRLFARTTARQTNHYH